MFLSENNENRFFCVCIMFQYSICSLQYDVFAEMLTLSIVESHIILYLNVDIVSEFR